jgi:chlorite dismutase
MSIKHQRPSNAHAEAASAMPDAPLTLEGFAMLHQFFRIRRREWNALDRNQRAAAIAQAAPVFAAMAHREDGESALFTELGHKGDLMVLHFRRTLDDLAAAERELERLVLREFLEQSSSYLSMVEIGLYEATVKLHAELAAKGLAPHSPEWRAAVDAALAAQRDKLVARLYPRIPDRHYLCFYPMNKRRAGADNWYSLPLAERQRLMHDHGIIGRRYAGRVTQVISGSIGFDDWEWGVDLFADDPLVFKQLVYEMRFDESSARYAEFGPFCVGIRLDPHALAETLAAPGGP